MRLFSAKQKKHLYVVSGGKCARCGGNLGDDWEAHHTKRYADGGVTELVNAAAVCRACHQAIHRKTDMKPRDWQITAFEKFQAKKGLCYLLEATPGAGKTIFSGFCAQHMLDYGLADFVVVVVPTTALKGDTYAGFLGDWNKVGVQITTTLKEGRDRPLEFRGAVITYAQLPNMVTTFETWRNQGVRIFFVFDEIHHACETNVWGQAAEACGRMAERVLGLTGTPFRGDGARISFVRYGDDGIAVPDYKYGYTQAVAEKVCRPVLFIHDDGVAEYVKYEREHQVIISLAEDEEISEVSSVIFRKDADWLMTVLDKANSKLEEYRITDTNAGGLIVCRPGVSDEDDRHLMQVAKALKAITGEDPTVVTHDDPEANAKIERFRGSHDKWIVAVRKISEGVDIKRLRVCVIASYPGTELMFRQIVGRVVRVEDKNAGEDATVYMAKFPRLVDFAGRMSQEAQAGLKARKEGPEKPPRENGQDSVSRFIPLGSTHEDGGAVSSLGEQFSAGEITSAENLKRGDRHLSTVSIAAIAHLLRKVGYQPEQDEEIFSEPLHVTKKKKRADLNKEVRVAAIRRANDLNLEKPDFQSVWGVIFSAVGASSLDDLFDNHEIERIDAAIDLARTLARGGFHAAA